MRLQLRMPERSASCARSRAVRSSWLGTSMTWVALGLGRQHTMKKFFSIMLLIFGMVGANTANAVFVFQANLTNDQETPPTPPEGSSGTALFVLNDAKT